MSSDTSVPDGRWSPDGTLAEHLATVEYDQDRGSVADGPHGPRVRRFLQQVTEDDHAWPMYYLGLAVLGGILLGVSAVWPVGASLTVPALAVVIGLLGTTAAGHWYREYRPSV